MNLWTFCCMYLVPLVCLVGPWDLCCEYIWYLEVSVSILTSWQYAHVRICNIAFCPISYKEGTMAEGNDPTVSHQSDSCCQFKQRLSCQQHLTVLQCQQRWLMGGLAVLIPRRHYAQGRRHHHYGATILVITFLLATNSEARTSN